MVTPPDDRADGGARTYVSQSDKWRPFEPELFDMSRTNFAEGCRNLCQVGNSRCPLKWTPELGPLVKV